MIKLFRNIRKNLLNEGKTTKYFKYAFGEIILVVIGILIALQINNWNEVQKNKKTERLFLTEIKTSLINDTLRIKDVLNFNENKIVIVDNLTKIFIDTLTNDDRYKIIESNVIAFTAYQVFNPKETTWNNLLSSTSLDIVQDSRLRNALIDYYGFDYNGSIQERIIHMNRKIIDDYFPEFFTKEYVQDAMGLRTNLPLQKDLKIHLNQQFLSDLYGVSYIINLQNTFLRDKLNEVKSTIKLIDQSTN
jgi:hypothetical protein